MRYYRIKLCSPLKDKGQSLVEFAIVLPILLIIVLGGVGVGLSLLAASQVGMAAFHGASVAVRTDAPTGTGSGPCLLTLTTDQNCSCPQSVISAVQVAVFQSLNMTAQSSVSADESIYGVLPVNTIGGSVSCSDNFARSQSSTTGSGIGLPTTVSVTITGDIALTFVPLVNPNIPITQSATAVVEPYRSRS